MQVFIGTADERLLKPHAFYQVHRITGKTVTTPSMERMMNGTKVLEIPLMPKNHMRVVWVAQRDYGIHVKRNSDTNVATFIPISHVNKSQVSSIDKVRVSVIIAIIFLSIPCHKRGFFCLFLLPTWLETWNAPLPVCQRLFSRTDLHDSGCSLQLWWTFCDYFDG